MTVAPPRRSRRLLAALVALEALACLGDLLCGPFARVHWEEAFNARAGVQLACGHWEALADLQYVSFCGGCTGEALLAVPLFAALGPTVLAWKLVPLAFHAVVLGAGAALLQRAAGPRAATAWVTLLAAAPGFYRELVLTGWGNHVESAAFGLGAAWLLTRAADARPARRTLLVALAGLVTGLGAWFCHTGAYAVPVLVLGTIWVAPGATPVFLVAAWAGFSPYRWYFDAQPDQMERTARWALNLSVAPPHRYVDWLWGPYLQWGLWDPADHGDGGRLRGAWWFAFWAAGLVGLVPALLGVARRSAGGWTQARASRGRQLARAYAGLGLLVLLAAYAVRFDLWSHLPEVPSQPTLGLRYRAPLVVLLGAGAAMWVGRTRAAWLAVGPLVAFGLSMRLGLWDDVHAEVLGLGVYGHDGWRDKSVPLGQPPQRLPRGQGRPQDIAAGVAFVATHDDPWPACAGDHLFEVGRRVGLGMADRGPTVADWDALDGLLEHPDDRRLLLDGVVSALVTPEGAGLEGLVSWQPALPSLWAEPLLEAAGRRVAGQVRTHNNASVQRGLCTAAGDRWLTELRAQAGRQAAMAHDLDNTCGEGFPNGAGWALAREVGCAEEARAAARSWGPEAQRGHDLGCAALRQP